MSRNLKLLKNSALYFLGSLGKGASKIIVAFIASYFINPNSLGVYDLVVSTIALLQPVIVFQIYDALFRWLLDKNINNDEVISIGLKIAFKNILIVDVILVISSFIFKSNISFILIFLLFNIQCIYPLIQQITRGLQNHKIFAISGIINAIIIISLSMIFMSYFKMGINGLYLAQIIADCAAIVFMIFTQKKVINVDFSYKNKQLTNDMLKFSLHMIPNSINEWMMKCMDRYCIIWILGSFFNGIYFVAYRFLEIFTMLNNMFYSSLVEQCVMENDSVDRDEYFSNLFKSYCQIVFGIMFVMIPMTKILIPFLSGAKFVSACFYTPMLYLGGIFFAFASFTGSIFVGVKETSELMKSSIVSAIINLALNLLFLKKFGLQIAAISTAVAYLFMWINRVILSKKYINLKIDFFAIFRYLCYFALITFGTYSNLCHKYILLTVFIAILLFIILNKQIFNLLYTKIRRTIWNKQN